MIGLCSVQLTDIGRLYAWVLHRVILGVCDDALESWGIIIVRSRHES